MPALFFPSFGALLYAFEFDEFIAGPPSETVQISKVNPPLALKMNRPRALKKMNPPLALDMDTLLASNMNLLLKIPLIFLSTLLLGFFILFIFFLLPVIAAVALTYVMRKGVVRGVRWCLQGR